MPVIIQFKTTYEGFVPSNMAKSAFNRMKKRAYRDIGVYWHRRMLPGHFTVLGGRKYNYTPRKGQDESKQSKRFKRSYSGRKWARFHHIKPLVFTGESEHASRIQDVRSTSKGVKVFLHTPRLSWRPAGGRINPREEVARILPHEEERLVRLFDKTIDQKLKRYRARRTVRAR